MAGARTRGSLRGGSSGVLRRTLCAGGRGTDDGPGAGPPAPRRTSPPYSRVSHTDASYASWLLSPPVRSSPHALSVSHVSPPRHEDAARSCRLNSLNRPAPRLGGPGAPAVKRPRKCKKPCHPPQLHPRVSYNPHPCSRSASNGDELGEIEEELITVHDVVRVLGCPQHLCREQIVVNAHGRCEVL